MSIRVTVTDTETGESSSATIDNDCIVITAGTCYVSNVADYPTKGTQVYTIKGRNGLGGAA